MSGIFSLPPVGKSAVNSVCHELRRVAYLVFLLHLVAFLLQTVDLTLVMLGFRVQLPYPAKGRSQLICGVDHLCYAAEKPAPHTAGEIGRQLTLKLTLANDAPCSPNLPRESGPCVSDHRQ